MKEMKFIKRLEILSTQWFYETPFFNEFIMRFSCYEDENINTIAIGLNKDKRNLCLYYNQDFINQLNDSDFEGVIVHEIMHVIALTYERKQSRDNKIWNIATDIANNYEIVKSFIGGRQLTLPKNGCFISMLNEMNQDGYKGKIIAEDIYDFIVSNANYRMIVDKFSNDNFDNHSKLEEKLSQNDSELFKEIARNIVNSAKTRKYGNITNSLIEKIEKLLQPKNNFLDQFLYYINLINFRGAKLKRGSYTKLNRKGYNELPGKIREAFNINVGVDTSGSISEKDLKMFFTEIEQFSKQYEINLIQFDCEVKSEQKYKPGMWRTIKITGGGGTDISAFYNYIDKKKTKESLNVIFTDGQFNWDIDWKKRKNKSLFIFCDNYKHYDSSIMGITL